MNHKNESTLQLKQNPLVGEDGQISKIANVDKDTLTAGKKDLQKLRQNPSAFRSAEETVSSYRIWKEGGGRKSITQTQPDIVEALLKLVDESSYGNPENPLSRTSKSVRRLAEDLKQEGYSVSHVKVKQLLEQEGDTLQTNRKLKQVGKSHENRDAQFQHINQTSSEYMSSGEPVISVDCKKKENLGEFANAGAEYHKFGELETVLDHYFFDKGSGKAIPYGAYDIANNEGYVNVGVSHDTASFAVSSIYAWWCEMGQNRYPNASMLYITADGETVRKLHKKLVVLEKSPT